MAEPDFSRRQFRIVLALILMACIVSFWIFGPTESQIIGRQQFLREAVAENYWIVLVGFCVSEVVLVGLSLPLATCLSLIAGLLFGPIIGTLAVSFTSTFGAWLSMLSARYLFRQSLRRRVALRPRWQAWLDAIDRGFERDGWFYMLLIRMTPIFPFFAVNLLSGLTKIRSRTYWWTSQIGMLPTTFVVVSAGSKAGEIKSFRELASFESLWPLIFLLAVPLALRALAGPYLRRVTRPQQVG